MRNSSGNLSDFPVTNLTFSVATVIKRQNPLTLMGLTLFALSIVKTLCFPNNHVKDFMIRPDKTRWVFDN